MNNQKKARKENGRTQVEVAEKIGLSQSSYSYWERGTTKIDNISLTRLSELFGVSVDYLLGNVDTPIQGNVKVPVLGSIPAGIPVEAVENILDWEEIPASWATGGREYFGLKVKGDSMYPKYLEGDTVILRKQNTCDSGDDCVVMVNGYDATLKQVFLREDGSMEIRPLNPSYPPTTYTPDDIAKLPVSIAGVVVELRRKIK